MILTDVLGAWRVDLARHEHMKDERGEVRVEHDRLELRGFDSMPRGIYAVEACDVDADGVTVHGGDPNTIVHVTFRRNDTGMQIDVKACDDVPWLGKFPIRRH